MTRLHYVKKARTDNPAVKKGESYYWWKFAFRSKQYSKTLPRRSQYMTQSEHLGGAYDIEDDIMTMTTEQVSDGCLDEFISAIEELKDNAEERLENIPDQLKDASAGSTLQEYIDAFGTWIDELQNVDFSELDEFERLLEAKRDEVLMTIQGISFQG